MADATRRSGGARGRSGDDVGIRVARLAPAPRFFCFIEFVVESKDAKRAPSLGEWRGRGAGGAGGELGRIRRRTGGCGPRYVGPPKRAGFPPNPPADLPPVSPPRWGPPGEGRRR